MPTAPKMDALSWGLLLVLSVLWGASFFFAKVALGQIPPLTLVLLRVLVASFVLHVALRLTGRKMPRDLRSLTLFAVLGFFNSAVPFTLLFWGQTRIDSGLAAILNAMTPISTILVAHVLTTDEKMSLAKIAGTLFGLSGVVVLVGPRALGEAGTALLAQLACLGATVSYGFAATIGRRLKGTDPMAIATGQLTASSLFMLPAAFVVDAPLALPPPAAATLLAVAALAVVSTALAFILYFTVIARAGATNAVLVTLLVPVTAVVLGAAILGERLPPAAFAGMALIAIGLLVIDGRLAARLVGGRARA